MSIYYLFIAFPLIIVAVFTMIFQSSLTEIEVEQFRMNCPLPIFEGVISNVAIEGVIIDFDITHNKDINGNITSNDQEKVGAKFECYDTQDVIGVSIATKQYGATLFDTIPYGWTGYVSDWLSQAGFKIGASLKLVYLLVNAPAEVTNLAWFSLLNILLFAFVGLGGFMVARGNGG